MSVGGMGRRRDERVLGRLLAGGTGVGCGLIALGLLVGPMPSAGGDVLHYGLVKAGIGAFVFLPTARVVLMLVMFLRKKEYVLAGAAAAVFLIIVLGCFLGALM